MSIKNLVYNPSFQDGSAGWKVNGSTITHDTTDSINGSNGSLFIQNGPAGGELISDYIPVDFNSTYSFEIDIKGVNQSKTNYIAIICYDANKSAISIVDVQPIGNTNTTLAQQLANGDTTVYLTSVANWNDSDTYNYIGICDSPAYGYIRNIYKQAYNKSSKNTTNNTITLSAAWTGGTWLAGTAVKNFRAGSTYIYPVYGTFATTWTHSTGTFTPRYGAKYIKLGVICYSGESFKIANVSIINTTKTQYRTIYSTLTTKNINKNGILKTNNITENFMSVRYIRDWVNGSDKNTSSHWCCIKAYDIMGNNVAFASSGKAYNGSNAEITPSITGKTPYNSSNSYFNKFHQITSETVATSPYMGGAPNLAYIVLDLQSIFDINKLIIWHYYGDSRIYNNTKTEVSVDGVNWVTVFDSALVGTYKETSTGHIIELNKNNVSLNKQGNLMCNEIYEN